MSPSWSASQRACSAIVRSSRVTRPQVSSSAIAARQRSANGWCRPGCMISGSASESSSSARPEPVLATAAGEDPAGDRGQPQQRDDRHPRGAGADDEQRRDGCERLLDGEQAAAGDQQLHRGGGEHDREAGKRPAPGAADAGPRGLGDDRDDRRDRHHRAGACRGATRAADAGGQLDARRRAARGEATMAPIGRSCDASMTGLGRTAGPDRAAAGLSAAGEGDAAGSSPEPAALERHRQVRVGGGVGDAGVVGLARDPGAVALRDGGDRVAAPRDRRGRGCRHRAARRAARRRRRRCAGCAAGSARNPSAAVAAPAPRRSAGIRRSSTRKFSSTFSAW